MIVRNWWVNNNSVCHKLILSVQVYSLYISENRKHVCSEARNDWCQLLCEYLYLASIFIRQTDKTWQYTGERQCHYHNNGLAWTRPGQTLCTAVLVSGYCWPGLVTLYTPLTLWTCMYYETCQYYKYVSIVIDWRKDRFVKFIKFLHRDHCIGAVHQCNRHGQV